MIQKIVLGVVTGILALTCGFCCAKNGAKIEKNVIEQCVAQGVPFAREYGGTLANEARYTRLTREFVKGETNLFAKN